MARGRAADVAELSRQLRLMHVLFGVGVAFFAAVVVVLAVIGVEPGEGAESLPLGTLSLVHAGVALASWTLARLGLEALFLRAPAGLRDPLERERSALARVRAVCVGRLACCEGPALFGLALMLMAVLSDTLAEQPYLALNALSTVVMLAYVVVAWPSEDDLGARVQALLRQG